MHAPLLTAVLLLAASAPSTAQALGTPSEAPALFEAAEGSSVQTNQRATTTRRRLVSVQHELLAPGARLTRFELELFDGEVLVVDHLHTQPTRTGGFVWTGDLSGQGDVVLAVEGDSVTGSIRHRERLLRLRPAGGAQQWLTLEDETAFAGCATEGSGAPLQGPSVPSNPSSTAAPRVDLLVVYSTEAKDAVGGTNAMISLIDLAVAETNQAYDACGVTQRLNLVRVEEMLGYNEPTSFSAILSHLTSTSDGRLDEVHALRDTYGADAVVMICENGQYCGIAHLMTNVSPSFQSQAFSVVHHGCATGYYSFGHELGHNFGSHHDPGNAGNAAYNYSYGYRTPDQQYRTIMAYAPGTRVKRFSGPSSSWLGNVMGNASQDNARSQNNTAGTVAAWRAAVAQPSTLQSTPLISGASATFTITGATPNSNVLLGYSLTGGGPMPSPFGTASLSSPVRLLTQLATGEAGNATFNTTIPLNLGGLPVWLQSLDPASGLLGNGLALTIQ